MIRLFWDYKGIPSSIVDIDSSITHGKICTIKPYGKKPATFLPEYNLHFTHMCGIQEFKNMSCSYLA